MSRILVVDDEKEFIEILSMRLKVMGHEVVAAHNGEEGLKAAESHSPDLILMDITMPVMDGYEACKRLKKNKKTKAIPIIMLTAVGHPDSITRSLETGAIDYIAKPFQPAVLMEKVRKALK